MATKTKQTSLNPATGATIRDYPVHTAEQVDRILAQAQAAFYDWRNVAMEERARLIMAVSQVLLAKKEIYARLISEEMGKPLKEALSEVEKCAACAKYFSEKGPAFLTDQNFATEYHRSYVSFRPLGVILGVMPWNFPFWQVFRFALPSLMAGNVGVLKHASNTPGCALAIAAVFKEAGLPEHAFQALLIPGDRVEGVIADRRIAAVTLTGSTPAGRSVASAAGKHLKKTVLELGGSDPYIVLADADLDAAVKAIGQGRLLNCGQSCVSPKRLIIAASLKERFEQGIADIFRKQVIGDPLNATTTMGPMSRADLRDELHDQVQRSIKAGARCILGGALPKDKPKGSAFYPPTILTDVKKGMPAYEEEMFGPVAVILSAKDEEEAIRIANDTVYGLGGAIFTKDRARGEILARERIETGGCFVNMMLRSDPRLPFGGVKDSGYGRELSSFGIHEFVNIKTVVVA